MLIRARRIARAGGRKALTQADVERVASEFTPARDEMAVEYQILVAAREATSREMIPEEYRRLSPLDLSRRIEELKALIR
jgi:hypothetical protein